MTTAPIIATLKETAAVRANGHVAEEANPPPPALPLNLAKLSDEVLALLAGAVPKEIADRQAKREADLFGEYKERARVLGVTPARFAAALGLKLPRAVEKASAADGRGSVKPKYRNPDNPSQLWTGRGKPPPWIELGDERSERGTPLPLAKFRIRDDEDEK
jgi:DNA-binding protein H-NS